MDPGFLSDDRAGSPKDGAAVNGGPPAYLLHIDGVALKKELKPREKQTRTVQLMGILAPVGTNSDRDPGPNDGPGPLLLTAALHATAIDQISSSIPNPSRQTATITTVYCNWW